MCRAKARDRRRRTRGDMRERPDREVLCHVLRVSPEDAQERRSLELGPVGRRRQAHVTPRGRTPPTHHPGSARAVPRALSLTGAAVLVAAGAVLAGAIATGGNAADTTTTETTTTTATETTTEPATTVVTTATVEQTTTHRVVVTPTETTSETSSASS